MKAENEFMYKFESEVDKNGKCLKVCEFYKTKRIGSQSCWLCGYNLGQTTNITKKGVEYIQVICKHPRI